MGKILDNINKPNDIKKISRREYPELAEEIRQFLIQSVSRTGGHLASNLGTVDLTIALHAVLNLPEDKIVWDVGHQAYTHKILTGRKECFGKLRKLDGLSGFPKRHESECDSFDTGHSSTSISAALGMAVANQLNGIDNRVVAVIGDGALTGGMALEALNNVAALNKNFVIVLNDNNMSISENVGSMSKYLNKLRVGEHYNDFKVDVENSLSKIPKIGGRLVRRVKRTKDSIKNLIISGGLFDDLGITYIGPVDGHDINAMIDIFNDALKIEHPIVIHVKTIKGKGYKFAEDSPSKFHGINCFDIETGTEIGIQKNKKLMTYTDVFSRTIIKLAKENKKIVAITAAMPDGTGLTDFAKEYPDRFFDVGIAEEHAVTFAAGLAASGYKPVVSIYSSFYQRAYDQILHDVCLQNLPVTFIVDRAGLVGRDGETHQGIFDISFMSAIPNMAIIAPKDTRELVSSLKFAMTYNGPIAVRFSRGTAYVGLGHAEEKIVFGKSQIIEKGKDVALIAVGNMVEETQRAVDVLKEKGVYPTFVNARFLKPLDEKLILQLAKSHRCLIIIEEGIKKGGYGEGIESLISENQINTRTLVMAIDNQFIEQGAVEELREKIGIDYKNICEKVLEIIK
ncbi:1-deoxy-D-xylulose-5-phosphate synthase [uncultured Eubacterium sp.]|uniref:1-deoxy-D-xylulose-5-phosphate synthase n=1 Tax=uncultured Eubacterium sp. TaxID=165185 RepID=UPI0026724D84|nr:1-deoxy-D-xylulose-5-phosphate synthase [uncultured Eubacterium sp.]